MWSEKRVMLYRWEWELPAFWGSASSEESVSAWEDPWRALGAEKARFAPLAQNTAWCLGASLFEEGSLAGPFFPRP